MNPELCRGAAEAPPPRRGTVLPNLAVAGDSDRDPAIFCHPESAAEPWQREDGIGSYYAAIEAIRAQVASGASVPTDGYFGTRGRFRAGRDGAGVQSTTLALMAALGEIHRGMA